VAYLATEGDFFAQPKVADAASQLLRDIFGEDKLPVRMVLGVASLPLGVPVVLEVLFEVEARRGERALAPSSSCEVCMTAKAWDQNRVSERPSGSSSRSSGGRSASSSQTYRRFIEFRRTRAARNRHLHHTRHTPTGDIL
jgi:hypothetical protein